MPHRLARLMRERQPCVALTGAGVSTESGIPDFRSPTGIWAQYDPMEYATIDAFRRDPVKVWDFYGKRLGALLEARPNAAHLALAELERLGHIAAVITQNIDRLHEAAGSRNVVEVHGSIRTSSCLACGERVAFDEVVRLLALHQRGPRAQRLDRSVQTDARAEPARPDSGTASGAAAAPPCPRCGEILKPDVVMFGELLPTEAIDRAFELAREARLMLVVGSSLEVHPVAGLPYETLQAGGEIAIVNRGSTPLDRRASLKLDGNAGEILGAVMTHLVARPPGSSVSPGRFRRTLE